MDADFATEDLERLILKRVLSDKNWLNIISGVYDSRWFKVPGIDIVLRTVIKYYNKYNTAPDVNIIKLATKRYFELHPEATLKQSDISELLTTVQNMNVNSADDVINSNIKEFIRRNAFYNSLFDNADILTNHPEQYQSVVDKCLENFDRVQKITFNDADLGMNYFDPATMAAHWDYIRNPEAKIKTMWDAIDDFTNGGFLKSGKMLGLVMAQAGLGKSVFLSNLAVNFLKQNLNVVVISLEMSEDVYATRFDAHISNKNINRLAENADEAIKRIQDFYTQYNNPRLWVKEYPPRSISSRDIETYLENLKNAGEHIDVIIVDYLNLVVPNRKTDSMFKDGMAVSEELRALSYKFNAPVISAVQANTEGMNNADIDMQNVSESRGICHTADFLAALYQVDEDRENGIINLKIIKNRLGGRVGKHATFKLDADTLTLADITYTGDVAGSSGRSSELGSILDNLQDISEDITQM